MRIALGKNGGAQNALQRRDVVGVVRRQIIGSVLVGSAAAPEVVMRIDEA